MEYLRRHSHVLVYDWTEPGDMEIVVEDIEALNFDFHEQTAEQQRDWRLGNEERKYKHSIVNLRAPVKYRSRGVWFVIPQ